MSAISSAGSADRAQMMQQMMQSMQGGGGRTGPPSEAKAMFESAAQSAGYDPSMIAEMRGELQSAAQSALEGAEGSTDAREAVESAMNEVFEKYGIDPEEFKSKMSSALGGMGRPGHAQGSGQMSGLSNDVGAVENDLLSSLLESLDSSEDESESDAYSFLEYLQNLPSGSLVNLTA